MSLTKEKLESVITKKGYKWYQNELNIIGIRNSAPGNTVTNLFDDKITVTYRVGDKWVVKEWEATTDPGKKAMLEHGNPKGVARLVAGQYVHCWNIGKHKGKYDALKQIAEVTITRDKDKDMVFDGTTIDKGVFGINIHKAGTNSTFVENWSEGCQVFKKEADFDEFMNICRNNGSSKFTYTLIESKDLA